MRKTVIEVFHVLFSWGQPKILSLGEFDESKKSLGF